MLLQHCQGHICHLDSSQAAWHSSLLTTTGVRDFVLFSCFFPPKLEIFEGDITVVLIKLKHHVFKGYRQNHLDADLLERQKGAMASALPGNESERSIKNPLIC